MSWRMSSDEHPPTFIASPVVLPAHSGDWDQPGPGMGSGLSSDWLLQVPARA